MRPNIRDEAIRPVLSGMQNGAEGEERVKKECVSISLSFVVTFESVAELIG